MLPYIFLSQNCLGNTLLRAFLSYVIVAAFGSLYLFKSDLCTSKAVEAPCVEHSLSVGMLEVKTAFSKWRPVVAINTVLLYNRAACMVADKSYSVGGLFYMADTALY